jgi:hypothetical protein
MISNSGMGEELTESFLTVSKKSGAHDIYQQYMA